MVLTAHREDDRSRLSAGVWPDMRNIIMKNSYVRLALAAAVILAVVLGYDPSS